MARRMPVTMAEQSPMVVSFFMSRRYPYSNSTQAATDTAMTVRARKPKKKMDPSMAGSRAMTTSSIMLLVLSGE